jgi:hypothetical protein
MIILISEFPVGMLERGKATSKFFNSQITGDGSRQYVLKSAAEYSKVSVLVRVCLFEILGFSTWFLRIPKHLWFNPSAISKRLLFKNWLIGILFVQK